MCQVNLFIVLYDLNLNLELERNVDSPPIAHFRFVNVVFECNLYLKDWKVLTGFSQHGIDQVEIVTQRNVFFSK